MHADQHTRRLLAVAADRAASRPFYLAHWLRRYRVERAMSAAGLAHELRIDAPTLDRLALCRCPARFDDVRIISEAFGLDSGTLTAIIEASGVELAP